VRLGAARRLDALPAEVAKAWRNLPKPRGPRGGGSFSPLAVFAQNPERTVRRGGETSNVDVARRLLRSPGDLPPELAKACRFLVDCSFGPLAVLDAFPDVDVDDFENHLTAARYLVRPGGPPVPERVAAACRKLISGSDGRTTARAKQVLESAAEGEESLADVARRLADGGELDASETAACAWAAENPLVASAAPSTTTLERRRAREAQAVCAAAVKELPPYVYRNNDRFQAKFTWNSDPRVKSREICFGTWNTPEDAAKAVHCALLRIEEPDKYANLLKHPCVAKLNLSETTTHSEKVNRIVDRAFTKRRKEDAKAIADLAAPSAGAAPSAPDEPKCCEGSACLSLTQGIPPVINHKRKGDASSKLQIRCVLCAARNAEHSTACTARLKKHKARG